MLHIFTLYYGKKEKFTKDNVNNLYKQIKKYYKGKFTFYCYTDKKEKLAAGIKKIKLIREKNPNVREAWYKIDFFKKDFVKYSKGDMCIVLDIDQEIVNDPTPLFDTKVPIGGIASLDKWWVMEEEPTCKLDGGFYKWYANTLSNVYDTFYEDPMKWMLHYWKEKIVTIPFFGEQNFVSEMTKKHVTVEGRLAARYREDKARQLQVSYFAVSNGDILRINNQWSDNLVLVHYSKFIG